MRFLPNGIEFLFFQSSFILYYYGLILMTGVAAGGWIASIMAKKLGQDSERTWDLMIWLIVGGIVGARIWHILTPSPSLVASGIDTMYYLTHPLDMINTRRGGLGIPGAIIGGVIAMYFFTRKNNLPFKPWLDAGSFGLALGQAIGRWGNYVNQELYGGPTNLPWKIFIEPQHRVSGFENVDYYHPLFLYESIWNFLNLGVMLLVYKKLNKYLRPGEIFIIYLMNYALGRFLLDFIRLDASLVGGINANQTVMLLIFIITLTIIIFRIFQLRVINDEK